MSLEYYHDREKADFSTGLMEQREQMAWMLRSLIEGEAISANSTRPDLAAKTPVGR
jgi:starvation-inducible DNA-binding protein